MTGWDWQIKSVLYRPSRYFDIEEHFRRILFWSSRYVNLHSFYWLLRVVFQSALNTVLWWAQQMVMILHECVCGDQRVLTIQTSGTGDAAAPANRKAHDKKSSRTCKIYIKQDKVNKADSAFIFLIILLISQNQWLGWSGRRKWSCLVWSLLGS